MERCNLLALGFGEDLRSRWGLAPVANSLCCKQEEYMIREPEILIMKISTLRTQDSRGVLELLGGGSRAY